MPFLRRGFLPLLALVLSACGQEIVYRDREPFNPPPDAQSGFLGYFDVATKKTTCGNCHVGHQRDWAGSAHRNAFATLEASPGKQAFCYNCHTVSQNGNVRTGASGWAAVQNAAYQDVQCESCHGPGLQHVEEPDRQSTWPIARAHVTDTTASCASCHAGLHHPFVEDWRRSGHANVVTSAASNVASGCNACHDGKAFIAASGDRTNYAEKNDGQPFPVTCSVCHDPHGSENSKSLRYAIDDPSPENNLCMRCHIRRVEPAPGSSQGARPHAPQGAVLLGVAGYRPDGFVYDTAAVLTTHASQRNPRLCAGCHVQNYTVNDASTGQFVVQATGHDFRPTPCVDGNRRPLADTTCAYTATVRSFRSCQSAQCHASEALAAQLFTGTRAEIENLARTLWIDTDLDGTIDAAPVDQGYLPLLKQSTPSLFAVDATITAAEGAEFNVRLAAERRAGNSDNSKGVHNPFLMRALLSASIADLRARYPSLPAPSVETEQLVQQSIRKVNGRFGGTQTISSR